MSNNIEINGFRLGLIIGIFISFIISAILSTLFQDHNIERGYIDACRDLYAGKLKYELKELPGGEKRWVKKESCK